MPSNTAALFGQQLQAAGFIQFMPQLFSSLIECMQAWSGQIVSQRKPLQSDSNNSSMRRQLRTVQDNPSLSSLLARAAKIALRHAWPPAVFVVEVVPDTTTAAVLQLCRLILQQTSQQLPAPDLAWSDLSLKSQEVLDQHIRQWLAVSSAFNTAVDPAVMRTAARHCSPSSAARHCTAVQSSPCTIAILAHLIVVDVHAVLLAAAVLLPELPRSPNSSNRAGVASGRTTNTSSSSSTNSSRAAAGNKQRGELYTDPTLTQTATAWELARKQVATGRLPATHQLLLEQLGVSPISALNLSATLSELYALHHDSSSGGSSTLDDATGVSQLHALLLAGVHRYMLLLEGQSFDSWPITARLLHLLLAPVLMYWAAHYPAQSHSTEVIDCSPMVHAAALAAKAAFSDTTQPAPERVYNMLQLVGEELVPLVTAVATSVTRTVLSTVGCSGAVINSVSGNSSTSNSSTAGSTSKRATATSRKPAMLAALHLLDIAQVWDCSAAEAVLCQLLEATFWRWRDVEQHADLVSELRLQLTILLKLIRTADGDFEDDSDSYSSSETGHGDSVCCASGGTTSSSSSSSSSSEPEGGASTTSVPLAGTTNSSTTTTTSGSSITNTTSSVGVLLAAAQAQGLHTSTGKLTPQQLQLASLCFSVMKMLTAVCEAHPDFFHTAAEPATRCCQLVAQAASDMLQWLAECHGDAGSSEAGGGNSSSSAQQAVATAVPWLVLSGRVLLFLAPRLPAATVAASSLDTTTPEEAPSEEEDDSLLQFVAAMAIVGPFLWLNKDGAADALAAAGYDPSGSLLQQLQAVCGAGDEGSSSSASTATSQLQPAALQSLGASLNTLPFACACNNPACANLSGPLEFKLVKGKGCVCGGCHVARFCSQACITQHWKQHKPVCRAVAAAAVDKGAATPAAQEAAPASSG